MKRSDRGRPFIKRYGTGSGSDLATRQAYTSRAPGRYRSLYRTRVENFITNYRMRTTTSSENLNKRALDPLALFVTRLESKSAFDSKIASVMKAPQTCVA